MNPRRPDILPDQIHADTLADAGFTVTIRDTQGRLTGHAVPRSQDRTTIPANGCYHDAEYEPGNATRYDLLLSKDDRGNLYLAWLNAPRGGRACRLLPHMHPSYLAEKMGLDYDRRSVDIEAIRGWLADQGCDYVTGD
jgi:hypothetical protein